MRILLTLVLGLFLVFTPATSARAAPEDLLTEKYLELGGEGSFLGQSMAPEICGLRDSGCSRRYHGGTIFWSMANGAYFSRGMILERYAANGWEAGHLGYPTSDEHCWIRGGCFQTFQFGSIYWSPATGAHFVRGAIREAWEREGWEVGHLGYPTSDEQCWIRGGCFQTFQGGSIYWSSATGAQFVRGAIRERWGREGWEAGHLGYPTSGEFCGLRERGCFQRFQNGSIYWSPATGAHFVRGAIRERWGSLGWESLRTPVVPEGGTTILRMPWGHDLGYPISGEFCGLIRGGCFQNFERGRIYWSPATGAHPVTPGRPTSNGGYWTAIGAERSPLGYPVSEEVVTAYPQSESVGQQRFENGTELADYPGHFDAAGNPIWAW